MTFYLESGAHSLGQQAQLDHDRCYSYADEYLQVLYKLFESSWENGVVLRDRCRRIFSDPGRIHEIRHVGEYSQVLGIHLCEPSSQRMSVLCQAGASSCGERFAAEHAECVFVAVPSKTMLKQAVADIRQRIAEAGRDPRKVLVFNLQTVVLGEIGAKTRAKFGEYRAFVSYEGALALISGWTGTDFDQYRPDQVLWHIHTNTIQSAVEASSSTDPKHTWTVRKLADQVGISGSGPLFVGSPATIVDPLQEWVEDVNADGFNLVYTLAHETFSDVIGLLAPELQKHGVYKTEYAPGTLCKKLLGGGLRLPDPHPTVGYHDLWVLWEEEAGHNALPA